MIETKAINAIESLDWYAFHFGSEYVRSPEFNLESLYGDQHKDCYIMVADLCSFTAFLRATDDVKIIDPLMKVFYSRMRVAIQRHHGMLHEIIGDSVVAVWGFHIRRSDLMEHVLATALELSQIAHDVAEEWQSNIDLWVEPKGIRIGLSKGELIVIRRDVCHEGLSVLGYPINLASRLQAIAQPNQLVCSNIAFRDIKRLALELTFAPFQDERGQPFVNARNYGLVRAWVLNLPKEGSGVSTNNFSLGGEVNHGMA